MASTSLTTLSPPACPFSNNNRRRLGWLRFPAYPYNKACVIWIVPRVNFYEGRGKYPRFKSKKRGSQTATYTATAFIWMDGTLTLAKMDAPLEIRWSRPLPKGAIPSTVTVSRDNAGRYARLVAG
jgi:hypothetical protein